MTIITTSVCSKEENVTATVTSSLIWIKKWLKLSVSGWNNPNKTDRRLCLSKYKWIQLISHRHPCATPTPGYFLVLVIDEQQQQFMTWPTTHSGDLKTFKTCKVCYFRVGLLRGRYVTLERLQLQYKANCFLGTLGDLHCSCMHPG